MQVYGSLPPSARTQQAQLFNRPRTGINVLAASDAIGMGLNLNIKCVSDPAFLHAAIPSGLYACTRV